MRRGSQNSLIHFNEAFIPYNELQFLDSYRSSRSITFTFSDIQSFELAMQDFHPRFHPSLVLKPGIICTFLIYSGRLQKMLTALFNLVLNTQKSIWTVFFECQVKVFLSIERILEKISLYQP